MSDKYLPANDAKFAIWLANFNSVAGTNATTLGLSPGDLNALTNSLKVLNAAMANVIVARAAAKNAVKTKNANRASSNAVVRGVVRRFQANPNVSDTLKEQLGIPVHIKPSGAVTPNVPADLVATAHAYGMNALKWKPNGNTSGAVYGVQSSPTGSSAWTLVGMSTKTRFDHEGVTPGQTLYYRVFAQRGAKASAPSSEAVVYAKQNANAAAKAAAAEPVVAETVASTPVLLLPTEKAA